MTIPRNLDVTPRYAFAAVTCKGFCVVCWGNAISTGSVKIFGCTAPMLLLWDRIPRKISWYMLIFPWIHDVRSQENAVKITIEGHL